MRYLWYRNRLDIFLTVLFKLIIRTIPYIIIYAIFYLIVNFFGQTMLIVILILLFVWFLSDEFSKEYVKEKEVNPFFK